MLVAEVVIIEHVVHHGRMRLNLGPLKLSQRLSLVVLVRRPKGNHGAEVDRQRLLENVLTSQALTIDLGLGLPHLVHKVRVEHFLHLEAAIATVADAFPLKFAFLQQFLHGLIDDKLARFIFVVEKSDGHGGTVGVLPDVLERLVQHNASVIGVYGRHVMNCIL